MERRDEYRIKTQENTKIPRTFPFRREYPRAVDHRAAVALPTRDEYTWVSAIFRLAAKRARASRRSKYSLPRLPRNFQFGANVSREWM